LKAIKLIAKREPIIPNIFNIKSGRYTGRLLSLIAAYGQRVLRINVSLNSFGEEKKYHT